MYRALIIDEDSRHAEQLDQLLSLRFVASDCVPCADEGFRILRVSAHEYALVIITISDNRSLWWRTLEKLQAACRSRRSWSLTLFLCVSKTDLRPESILRLEGAGARYVRER